MTKSSQGGNLPRVQANLLRKRSSGAGPHKQGPARERSRQAQKRVAIEDSAADDRESNDQ